MQRLLDEHHRRCAFVLASRADDRARLAALLGPDRVGLLRRGIERDVFDPGRRDRAWLAATLGIPPDRQLVISRGPPRSRSRTCWCWRRRSARLIDRGRRICTSCAPGKGPDRDAVIALLGDRVDLSGRARSGHAGARLRVGRSVRPAGGDRGAVERRARSRELRPAAGRRGGQRQRAVPRRGQDRAGRAGGDAGGVGGALAELLGDPQRLAAMGREAHAWSLPTPRPGARC